MEKVTARRRRNRDPFHSPQQEAWDLNVPVSLSEEETISRVKTAAELGYRHIVLNFEIEVPKENRPVRLPSYSIFTSLRSALSLPENVRLYSRVTFLAEDMSVARILRDPGIGNFDIVALRPLGEQLLTPACEGQLPVDIISFSVALWTPNTLRHTLLHASGLTCELSYGPMIRDQSMRCSTIAFAQVLTARSKGGKGCFALSGEARVPIELRPPADVANLAAFLGLDARDGWASIVDAPFAAHRRALTRRGIWGIEVVPHSTPIESTAESKKPKKSKKIGE